MAPTYFIIVKKFTIGIKICALMQTERFFILPLVTLPSNSCIFLNHEGRNNVAFFHLYFLNKKFIKEIKKIPIIPHLETSAKKSPSMRLLSVLKLSGNIEDDILQYWRRSSAIKFDSQIWSMFTIMTYVLRKQSLKRRIQLRKILKKHWGLKV